MMIDLAQHFEGEVRERVRKNSINPYRDGEQLEAIITQVLDEYEADAVRGLNSGLRDRAGVYRCIKDAVGGYGVLQPLLDDPDIEEIWIDSPSKIFISKNGYTELSTIILTDSQVKDTVEKMLQASGRRIDLTTPFVDASLATGERLHVVIPDVTRQHWAVNIRKYVLKAHSLNELVSTELLSEEAADFLDKAVRAGLNVLVSGATQAGKTTFLRALLGSVPPHERIVSAEEVFELELHHRDVVAMQTRPPSIEGRGEITLRRLVRESLRMRPERIVIGEVRSDEAFDLLVALNAGIPGACTIHANSAREAIVKLCTLPLLAGENVTSSFVVPTVASALDLVVHLSRSPQGQRCVEEIVAVTGRVEAEHVDAHTLFARHDGTLVRVGADVPRPERFARAGIAVDTMWEAA